MQDIYQEVTMKVRSVSRRDFIKVGAACGLSTSALHTGAARGESPISAENGLPDGKVRLAVVQMETVPGAVERNRARALAFAGEAVKKGADIVLFHEELLVGYVTNLKELAEVTDGLTSRAFQSLLAGSRSLVLWGLTQLSQLRTILSEI
jgi:hypothetical protein